MKALLITTIVFFSLKAFSSEVGEDKKGECKFSNQSAKREAKVIVEPNSEAVKKEESVAVKK